MQPSKKDEFSVSRRTLDVEDYIDIIRRHRAWILGPAFLAVVASVVVAFLWPDTYVSEAVIRVQAPLVPEKYVPSNINVEMGQRINSMAQQILSRATLTNVIQTFDLYRSDRKRLPLEDVIEDMRKDIRVGNVMSVQREHSVTAFAISFAYEDRNKAQKVCSDLVGRFIDENIRSRATQSVSTTTFLKDQLEQARKDLDEKERALGAFRARNQGRLPDQLERSMQMLASIESQMNNVSGSINRATQEKMVLESRLQTFRNQLIQAQQIPPTPEQAVRAREANQRIAQLDRDIQNVEMLLTEALERYTDSHPTVQQLRTRVATLQKTRAELQQQDEQRAQETEKANEKEKASSVPAPRRVDPLAAREIQAIQAAIEQTGALVHAKEMEIEDLHKELKRLDANARERRAVLQANPANEGEYSILLQDRDVARKRYDELQAKSGQSEMATDLENRKQGETLELLDAASLPQTPTAPKRWLIIGVGVALGVMLGISLAGAREMRDTSLKNLKDVRAYTQLTVLASVPLLENDLVVRRRRRLAWMAWSTVTLVGIGILAGSVLYYYQWNRI